MRKFNVGDRVRVKPIQTWCPDGCNAVILRPHGGSYYGNTNCFIVSLDIPMRPLPDGGVDERVIQANGLELIKPRKTEPLPLPG